MDWLRWWHGTVNDPKFKGVAKKAGCNVGEVIAVWACLMERASSVTQCDAGVRRGDIGGFSCDDYDIELGFPDGQCARVVAALTDRGMIADGRISQWEKRQPKREDSSAERMREHRARQKLPPQLGGDDDETPSDADVTQGDAPEKIREEKRRSKRVKVASTKNLVATPSDASSRGTRLPNGKDWVLPKAWGLESVSAYSPPKGFILEEAAKFRDHWIAQPGVKGRKTDWEATWRNWMRKANADRLIAENRMQSRSPRAGDIKGVSDANAAALAEYLAGQQPPQHLESGAPA